MTDGDANDDVWKSELENGFGMPSVGALQFHYRKAGRVISLVEDVDVEVPASWRALLEAQHAKREIPWEIVWGPVWDLFPAIKLFLKEKCYGAIVFIPRKKAPQLGYVYGSPSAMIRYGRRLVGMMVGGIPTKPPAVVVEDPGSWWNGLQGSRI